ncbi:MAG: DUF1992 domain-containing protein [Flexistipes sinusarabici]|uniref:DUF1992 domain-containing protein n=1 Tax=Flexistipes sinusarabici TaxID=2352 RepID=A0A5D0MQ27_FLESI|nr:DUF1992 domain-containing protein [Flexistipes sinusarabici]TYB34622.1 MAG: DUF1992 domain-containing protein [Flexistipes sinusarabici]
MDVVTAMAENKIKEAVENGELDDIKGKGKPLHLEDLSRIPEELRAGYILLKNSGVLPEEINLKNEIKKLEDLLDYCYDDKEYRKIKFKLNEKILHYNILMDKKGKTAAHLEYENKILDRLQKG